MAQTTFPQKVYAPETTERAGASVPLAWDSVFYAFIQRLDLPYGPASVSAAVTKVSDKACSTVAACDANVVGTAAAWLKVPAAIAKVYKGLGTANAAANASTITP